MMGYSPELSTTDLDVIEFDWEMNSKAKRLYITISSEPAFGGLILSNGIIGNRKPVIKFNSKWFYDSTFGNTEFKLTDSGASLYKLKGDNYFLELVNWRPFNMHDPANDWLSTYPLVSAVCKWAYTNNFTDIVSLSSSVLHDFINSPKYKAFPPEELYVFDVHTSKYVKKPAKPKNKKQEMMLSPPHFLFTRVWSEFMPTGKALNVIAGSDGVDSIDIKAVNTLCAYLKSEGITISQKTIDKTYTEIQKAQKESDAISESLITNKANPSNNGVMYG